MLCCARLLCRVPLFATPWTVAPPAPLSMGFSRTDYQSELSCPPPGDLPDPGLKPISPTLQADSLLSEPNGKPTNTGVGNLSLLQGHFATQRLNPDLLHCRQIPYQLSYQGSPLLYSTGNSTQYLVMTHTGKKIYKRMGICKTDSLYCTEEANITLQIYYASIIFF